MKWFTCAAVVAVSMITLSESASAQSFQAAFAPQKLFQSTYKIQVEYWFFDTDAYHWSTVFETTDYDDAQMVHKLLQFADDHGSLIQFVPSDNPRYIPVNVRMLNHRPVIWSLFGF